VSNQIVQRDRHAAYVSALALLAAQARFQILCALRQGPLGTQRLNRLAARALGAPPDESWFAGRPVIVTRNDHALGLMNGDMGLVLPHADGGLKAAFATGDGRVRWCRRPAWRRWRRPGR
jgi:exodeoxyribonuclease V alpha subunit